MDVAFRKESSWSCEILNNTSVTTFLNLSETVKTEDPKEILFILIVLIGWRHRPGAQLLGST